MNKINNNKRLAVISGGFGLLGKAIGQQLSKDGFAVALLYHETPKSEVKKICESFSSPDVFVYQCDIKNPDEVAKVLQKIEKNIGPIYIGIHCANSPIIRKKVSDLDLETFKAQFNVGLFGGFSFFKNITLLLKQRREGTLIGLTTSAIEENLVSGNFGGYISAKSALKGLLKEFANELKQYNVRVYAIAPGFIAGGINADIPDRFIELLKEKFPNQQLTKPQDVAKTISLLCSKTEGKSDNLNILVDKFFLKK
ncbi:MAG: SDR family oxidoreductase [Candidatus Portnoybacteria bacterium]|nr:SDR family oxidoreductase [Candidatus Portnoybacteria bacterium]